MKLIFASLIMLMSFSQYSLAQTDRDVFLIARNTGKKGLANKDTIRVFGFAENLLQQPNVPGPTIYANQGDSVHIDVWNVSQGAGHTIHLHGLDVDQQNDGVPHLSFEIDHMDHGYYHFKAPHAGTYLYHCHVASTIHVQAGMYGLIIIRPSDGSKTTWDGGYSYEREQSFMLSEIDPLWHEDSVLNHPHGPGHSDITIPRYQPSFFLINGYSDNQLAEYNIEIVNQINTNTYLRFANIGFNANQIIFPSSCNAQIVSSDGRPLPNVENTDTLMVLPGERYGVLINGNAITLDSVQFNYLDLNTWTLLNTQWVPLKVVNTLSINSPKKINTRVIPNPIHNSFSILSDIKAGEQVLINIKDPQGKAVWTGQQVQSNDGKISVDINLASSIYYIELISENGSIYYAKALKF